MRPSRFAAVGRLVRFIRRSYAGPASRAPRHPVGVNASVRMVALAAFAALLLVPVVGAAQAPTTLHADVAEWSVVPGSGVVPAGRVKLVVRNIGRQSHELVVVRTKQFGEPLRLSGDRAVVRPVAPRLLVPSCTPRSRVF